MSESNSNTWIASNIAINTRVNVGGETKAIALGFAPYYYPTLNMVDSSFPAPDRIEAVEEKNDKGEVLAIVNNAIYDDDKLAYLQDSLRMRIESGVRSSIKITKDGDTASHTIDREPAQDFEQLFESSGARGQFFAIRKLFVSSIEQFLQAVGKPAGTIQQVAKWMTNPENLSSQKPEVKAKIGAMLDSFEGAIDDEAKASIASYMAKVRSALAAEVGEIDLDF